MSGGSASIHFHIVGKLRIVLHATLGTFAAKSHHELPVAVNMVGPCARLFLRRLLFSDLAYFRSGCRQDFRPRDG